MIAVTILLLSLLFVGYLGYLLFWKPLQRNKWYVKTYGKRCKSIYYPLIGNIKFVRESFRKYGDSLKWIRDLLQDDNEAQFFVGYTNIHIVDADLAKDLLLNNIQKIEKSQQMEFKEMFFEKGLLFAEGERWRKQRNILSHSFSYDVLKNRIPKIDEIVKKMVQKIDTQEGKTPMHITEECQKITAEVVLRTFFGDRFSEQLYEGQNLGLYLTFLLSLAFNETRRLRNILPKLFLPKTFHSLFHDTQHKEAGDKCLKFRQFIEKEVNLRIDNYKNDKETKDFLDILVDEHVASKSRNNGESESFVSIESLTDQFLSFFFAGMDTTGNLASVMIYWLAKRSDVLAKVSQEIDSVFGKDEQITDEKLKQLNYCHMFISETLRYHCPAMLLIPRKVKEDFIIGDDIQVKKGMDINISLHGLLRRPKYFENPDEFNPDRFNEANKRNINHLAFIPFSSGPKNCIGQHMAQIEAKIILIHFIRNFKITLNEDIPLKMDSNTLYSPADDRLVFLERKEK